MTMLYWLFNTYGGIWNYFCLAPLVLGCMALIVAGTVMLGPVGRKSLTEPLGYKQKRITTGSMLIGALAALHMALPFLRNYALERATPTTNSVVLQLLVGPPEYSLRRLVAASGYLVFVAAFGAILTGYVISDGGPLREFIHRLRNPRRVRQDLGSATFCLPGDFLRLQKPKPDGLPILGAFYGKSARFGKPDNFFRLDAGAYRGPDAGKGVCISLEDQARGMCLIGTTGSGKSQAGIIPFAADTMDLGHSLILVDPQGELTKHILSIAAVTGHRVIVHDPTSLDHPRYNLAQNIQNVMDAQAITQVLIPDPPTQTHDSFWTQSAQSLLAACLLRYANLGEILLAMSDIKKLAERLGDTDDGAARLAASFIASAQSDGKIAASTIATLQQKINSWAEETVRLATADTDFTADMLIDYPSVIILRCPGQYGEVYGPYLGAVLRRLMLDLNVIGESQPSGELPRPVKIILDEFPTLGRLEAVVKAVNLFRKRRISFLIAFQTVSQLSMIYGEKAAESLIAGLATQIIFGACDYPTASYVSRLLGKTTDQQWSRKEGADPNVRQRDLMSPEEVITPARGNSTLIFRYATPTYATQLVMYAEYAYMFQRQDWQKRISALGPDSQPIVLQKPPFADAQARAAEKKLLGSPEVKNPSITYGSMARSLGQ